MSTIDHDQHRGPRTDQERARIAARYPQRPALHRWLVIAAGVLAVLGLAWTTWAGLHHARPAVDADVHGFTVPSDQRIDVDLRVQRRDPGKAAVCTVKATSPESVSVGELDARIEPGTEKITRVRVQVKTIGRATTATVERCRVA